MIKTQEEYKICPKCNFKHNEIVIICEKCGYEIEKDIRKGQEIFKQYLELIKEMGMFFPKDSNLGRYYPQISLKWRSNNDEI